MLLSVLVHNAMSFLLKFQKFVSKISSDYLKLVMCHQVSIGYDWQHDCCFHIIIDSLKVWSNEISESHLTCYCILFGICCDDDETAVAGEKLIDG